MLEWAVQDPARTGVSADHIGGYNKGPAGARTLLRTLFIQRQRTLIHAFLRAMAGTGTPDPRQALVRSLPAKTPVTPKSQARPRQR
jgi:hypothetical protein